MHTKGPWTVDEGDTVYFIEGENRDGHPIAVLDKWDDTDKANAHLIAAVTDLLAACKGFINTFNEYFDIENCPTEEQAAYQAAKDAIAKVEGE